MTFSQGSLFWVLFSPHCPIAEATEEHIKEIRQKKNENVMKVDPETTHLKGIDKVINAIGCNLLFDWFSCQ